MSRTLIAVSVVAVVAAAGGAVSGSVVHHSELPGGQSSVSMAKDSLGISVATSVRQFKSKTTNGTSGVGVSGGSVNGEIDGSESIVFLFAEPVHITGLRIGQLYTDGNFGDVGDEAALFETSAGSFRLVADTASTALWDGFGVASNVSVANNSGGGEWEVAGQSIFGEPITELVLRSGSAGGNASFGDYTFVSLSYQMVPTPGAVSLAALGGLLIAKRRRA